MKFTLGIPVLLDQIPSFALKDLIALGLFTGYGEAKQINIRRNGFVEYRCSIWVAVDLKAENPSIELSYSIDGKEICYDVELIRVESNLIKGKFFWKMLCPITGDPCWKLYLHRRHFVSRLAIDNRYYSRDILSKRNRNQHSFFLHLMKSEKVLKESRRRYFIDTYAGMETKVAIKLRKAKKFIEIAAKINL